MKITVIGAAGRLGGMLIKEALVRGHEVTAAVRDVYMVPNPKVKVWEGDVHDLRSSDLAGQDAVIDSFGVWEKSKAAQHVTSLRHLADILSGTGTRLLAVGTPGSLYVDDACTVRIIDLPDFPKGAYPVVKSMCEAYDMLRARTDLSWTYLTPAPDFRADGERGGIYRIAGDTVPRNARGKSGISYADFAAAALDEAENGEYPNRRVTFYAV